MCDLRSPGVGKDLEQRLHLCGFSCERKEEGYFGMCADLSKDEWKDLYIVCV